MHSEKITKKKIYLKKFLSKNIILKKFWYINLIKSDIIILCFIINCVIQLKKKYCFFK